MDVSIIIVNYNTCALLKNCLNSIYNNTKGISFEILVSDNNSSDDSMKMVLSEFPDVIFIENNKNLGFGAANNRALYKATGKYIFYLNSDTLLKNNAVKYFFDYWENSPFKTDIGSLGCNLTDQNGRISHSYGNFPSAYSFLKNTIHDFLSVSKYTLLYILFSDKIPLCKDLNPIKYFKTGSVDYITGADLFLLNDEYAFFDEHYFMYCEEIDLQYKLNKNNKKSLLINGPEIVHLKGASATIYQDIIHIHASFSKINDNISRLYFIEKNYHSYFLSFIIKMILSLLWCNPLLFHKTSKYLMKMIRK